MAWMIHTTMLNPTESAVHAKARMVRRSSLAPSGRAATPRPDTTAGWSKKGSPVGLPPHGADACVNIPSDVPVTGDVTAVLRRVAQGECGATERQRPVHEAVEQRVLERSPAAVGAFCGSGTEAFVSSAEGPWT